MNKPNKHLFIKTDIARISCSPLTLVFISTVISIFRSPEITLQGRFFAEEGALFWANALQVPWYKELFYVAPIAGYFLSVSNIATAISSHLPLIISPLFSVWLSLFLQLVPSLFVLKFAPKDFGWFRIAWAYLYILAIPVLNSEVFANSINSQVFLALGTFVILILLPLSREIGSSKFVKFYLLIAVTSGWYSLALLPLIFMHIYRLRSLHKFRDFVIIFCIGLCIQVFTFFFSRERGLLSPERFTADLSLKGLLGDQRELLRLAFEGDMGLTKIRIVFLTCISISAFAFYVFYARTSLRVSINLRDTSGVFFGYTFVALLVEFSLIEFGRTNAVSGRYSVLPGILSLTLIVFASLYLSGFKYLKCRSEALIWVLLCLGIAGLFQPKTNFVVCEVGCRSWRSQVHDIQVGRNSVVYHWLQSDEDSRWKTDLIHPKPQLAPDQLKILED